MVCQIDQRPRIHKTFEVISSSLQLSVQLLLSALCYTVFTWGTDSATNTIAVLFYLYNLSKQCETTSRLMTSPAAKGASKKHPRKHRPKEAIMMSRQKDNHASVSGKQKFRDQRTRTDRRARRNPGYCYMHTIGWVCRREKQRRKSDRVDI